MPTEAHVLRTANDLTAVWLQGSMGTGPIAAFDVEQISTGQMSRNYRVAIQYQSDTDAGPRSVVLKTASPDDGGVTEPGNVAATEEVGPDGLITSARISLDDLQLKVEPLAFGPLLLEAPDGRISEFPRAMCVVRDHDGRRGVAWVEWNRNRSLA